MTLQLSSITLFELVEQPISVSKLRNMNDVLSKFIFCFLSGAVLIII